MKNSFIYKFTNNDSLIDNILKKYKMEEIIKNPYSLIEFINLDEIDKVITNDKSFNELELKSNRIRAYIFECVNKTIDNNHTAVLKREVYDYIRSKTNADIEEVSIANEINVLIDDGIYLKNINENFLTTKYYYEVENYILETVLFNSEIEKGVILNQEELEEYMNECEIKQGFQYDTKQRDILIYINKRKNINFLNGYAGTGKTTTAKGVLDLYSKYTDKIICAAFSGVASARIKHATGYKSITVHSLLNYDGEKFNRNEKNKLDYDFIFIDESGMTDSELFAILLNAIDFRRTEVLFAGDLGQVQPVGNGDPFRDILVNKITNNIITLDKVYRQKEEQAINIIAQDIRKGQIPNYLDKYEDFEFINSLGQNIFEDFEKEIFKIKDELDALLNQKKYSEFINLFQVITPIRKSEYGVDELNMFVQNILNEKELQNKIEFDNKTIKMYDKVMHLQNRNMKTIDYSKFVQLNENDILDNYTTERKVMNGQVGIVLRVTSDVRNKLYVYYPLDDYVAIYTLSDVIKFKIIDLGYVMTVHKSQGSQYSRLLMPMVSRFSIMLNTQLLYTAVTRAKDMLTIIGEKRAFEEASTNISKNRRMTLLNNYQENN